MLCEVGLKHVIADHIMNPSLIYTSVTVPVTTATETKSGKTDTSELIGKFTLVCRGGK